MDLPLRATARYTAADVTPGGPPHPAETLALLADALKDETPRPVLCVDTGDVTLWASLCYPRRAASRTTLDGG